MGTNDEISICDKCGTPDVDIGIQFRHQDHCQYYQYLDTASITGQHCINWVLYGTSSARYRHHLDNIRYIKVLFELMNIQFTEFKIWTPHVNIHELWTSDFEALIAVTTYYTMAEIYENCTLEEFMKESYEH